MKYTAIKPILLLSLATLPCSCTTVVEPPPKPDTTTTVHRETHSTQIHPLAPATRTQTTTTIRE